MGGVIEMLRPESELTEAQISLQREIYGTPRMHPKVIPECPECKGQGWIWYNDVNNHEEPIVRRRKCTRCDGTGSADGCKGECVLKSLDWIFERARDDLRG